jgi:hypothetical protein
VIKLTVLVKRNPGASVEEFHEEWRAHGRMIAAEPVFARYIKRYEQHHRVPAELPHGDTTTAWPCSGSSPTRTSPSLLQNAGVHGQDAARRDAHPRPHAAWSSCSPRRPRLLPA